MEINVGDVLQPRYDMTLIAGSYLVSVMGSYAALFHAQHMYKPGGAVNRSMAFGAAVGLGGIGIWTMHFIGMIGYRLGVGVVYDAALTMLSLAAAVVIAGCALLLAGGRGKFSTPGWVAGSLLAGTGVCVMHYMGMYAMRLRATMSLDVSMVLWSWLIAVAAAAAALWLAFHVSKSHHRLLAAGVMGLAVCAMHYTGMSAAQFICTESRRPPDWAIGGVYLVPLVYTVAGLVAVYLFFSLFGFLEQAEAQRRRR